MLAQWFGISSSSEFQERRLTSDSHVLIVERAIQWHEKVEGVGPAIEIEVDQSLVRSRLDVLRVGLCLVTARTLRKGRPNGGGTQVRG